MACKPISVSLEVNPSPDRKIILQLDKLCNPDDTAEWKLHFDLQEKNSAGAMVSIVKLDVDINKEDHPAAEATASHGLDASQRGQAAIAGDTAKAFKLGTASEDDAKEDAASIIPSRDANSPS